MVISYCLGPLHIGELNKSTGDEAHTVVSRRC